MTVAIAGAVRWAAGLWRGAIVWKLSGSCLGVVCCWIGGHGLSGGCLAVVWPWTRTLDMIGAADFVGSVSLTDAIAGAVRWAAGLWISLSGSCLEVA